MLLGCLLLVGYGLLASLAGAGVVLGTLTANGESETMTDSAVATDIHKTLDVHLDGRAELSLDSVLRGDFCTDGSNLSIVPVTNLEGSVDSALLENLLRRRAADSEDIGETYLSAFIVW